MIEVFKQERLDGIAELMVGESLAYLTEVRIPHVFEFSQISTMLAKADLEEFTDNTLFPIESVLASIGINLNDDVFLAEELLKAKRTPINKPFNKMHNGDDIIGHMTASRLLDENYNEATDQNFTHIAVSSVIYKVWRDKDREQEVAQLIEEIKAGKWKVSMECIFPHFDYAMITPAGKQLIIPRNESTAYLTKHLRKYGGPGYYDNNKLGRVFRDLTFCGKGLVEHPGNQYSFILNKNEKFSGALASLEEIKEMVMTEQEKADLDKALREAAQAKAELETYKADAAKAAAEKLNEAVAQRDAVIAEQKAAIAGLQADISTLNVSLAGVNEVLETAKAEITEKSTKLASAEASLETIRVEKAVAVRKQALAEAGVSPEKAEALLTKFASANDELFNTLVNTIAEAKFFEKKDDKEDKKEEAGKMDETCDKADFSKASLDSQADLNVVTAGKVDEDSKKISAYLTKNVLTAGKTANTKGDK